MHSAAEVQNLTFVVQSPILFAAVQILSGAES
jgi:hypothetical protein